MRNLEILNSTHLYACLREIAEENDFVAYAERARRVVRGVDVIETRRGVGGLPSGVTTCDIKATYLRVSHQKKFKSLWNRCCTRRDSRAKKRRYVRIIYSRCIDSCLDKHLGTKSFATRYRFIMKQLKFIFKPWRALNPTRLKTSRSFTKKTEGRLLILNKYVLMF